MSNERKGFTIQTGGNVPQKALGSLVNAMPGPTTIERSDAPVVVVDTHGRVIRSPETEAEIAALKARIAELEGRAMMPSTVEATLVKPLQFIDVNEHSYVAAHIDFDECPRCKNGVMTHPQISRDGSAWEAEKCTVCNCHWWFQFPREPEPEMVRPRKTNTVDDNTPIIAGMSKQVMLTSAVVYVTGLDANGDPITEELRVPVATSVDDVARFAGAGGEAHRMAQTILNPSTETWDQKRARREREAFTKATKIAANDYTGWVSVPGFGTDGFFKSINELREHCKKFDVPVPEFVWACTPEPLKLDADGILDQALGDHSDGARGNISDAEEARLQAFLDEWAAAQEIVSWHEDNSRAVIL